MLRTILLTLLVPAVLSAQSSLSTAGVLRAAYLSSNPAQATVDPATGATRGVVVDLTTALGKRLGVEVRLIPSRNPQAVIDAVQSGQADIGFVAYNPERAGPVEFSKPYLLVQQTFAVREDSGIRTVADLDRQGVKLGATRGDSIALYLGRTLKQAELVELTDANSAETLQSLREGRIDAVGANRQRLTDTLRTAPGFRLLPDDLYGVEQTIIVGKGKTEGIKVLNEFIDEVRRSGVLQSAIERSGVVGIRIAP